METPYYAERVGRVAQVLDCFTFEEPELRLTDISERLMISKAQALRVLSTLEVHGYVARHPDTKRYRLGLRLFHLGMIVRQFMNVQHVARPYLRQLVEATRETTALFIADADGPICVDIAESPRSIRAYAQVGKRMPWHAGPSPKVLLAYLPEDLREAILARGDFARFTASTTTDPDQLRQELEHLRVNGYCVAARDIDDEALGVSAPVFDDKGEVVAAIGVGGPVSRLTEDAVPGLVDHVRHTASEVSRQLGYDARLLSPAVPGGAAGRGA